MQAFQAELSLRQGQLIAAVQWADQLDPPPMTPMTHLYAPHMTLVKVWLAEDTPASRQKAAALLAQLKEFFESTHNTVFLIESLALLAILHRQNGDESTALNTLEQALGLAVPGNFIRLFVDLGPPMGNLLCKLTLKETELAAYKRQILATMSPLTNQQDYSLKDGCGSQPLIKPLTDREMDVMLLLGERQTDREIAETLVISVSTVRSHTKSIYGKLGVNNRRQAAVRAQELGLMVSA